MASLERQLAGAGASSSIGRLIDTSYTIFIVEKTAIVGRPSVLDDVLVMVVQVHVRRYELKTRLICLYFGQIHRGLYDKWVYSFTE